MISCKGAHFPQDIMLTGVRWYVAYPLSYRHVEGSSRAQARTTVGREFPISALSIAERGPSPAIAHVSCTLSKIPYGGFSPVRLQAEVSPRSTLPCPFQA